MPLRAGERMRYLRLIILVVFVYWTYTGMNQTLKVSVYTHSVIQEDLRGIITSAIRDALPEATNIRFYKMNTESIGDNQVVASFLYGFNTVTELETDYRMIEGSALLNRYNEEGEAEVWSLDRIQLEKEAIEYTEPLLIEIE